MLILRKEPVYAAEPGAGPGGVTCFAATPSSVHCSLLLRF